MAKKVLVAVNGFVSLAADLDEVVHVQLSVEGAVVMVFEELGENSFGQFTNALDDEGVSFGRPANHVIVLFVLG